MQHSWCCSSSQIHSAKAREAKGAPVEICDFCRKTRGNTIALQLGVYHLFMSQRSEEGRRCPMNSECHLATARCKRNRWSQLRIDAQTMVWPGEVGIPIYISQSSQKVSTTDGTQTIKESKRSCSLGALSCFTTSFLSLSLSDWFFIILRSIISKSVCYPPLANKPSFNSVP